MVKNIIETKIENPFDNMFTLKFKNAKLEDEYQNYILDILFEKQKILHIKISLISTTSLILCFFLSNKIKNQNIALSLVFITLLIVLIIVRFFMINQKGRRLFIIRNLLSSTNVILSLLNVQFLGMIINQLYPDNIVVLFIFYTLNQLFTILIGRNYEKRSKIYFPSLIVYLTLSWGINIKLISSYDSNNIVYSNIALTFFVLMCGIFVYGNEKQDKIAYLNKYFIRVKSTQFTDMFNNLNNGILIFSKSSLIYMNNFYLKIKNLIRLKSQDPSLNISNLDVIGKNNENISIEVKEGTLNINCLNIISDLKEKNRSLPSEFYLNTEGNEISMFTIITYLENLENLFQNFNYLGTKEFMCREDDSIITLEIFLRISRNIEEESIFEFMLNDITRVKVVEEVNAQIKYKTVFLAKAAHEFKNPLITISELINETNLLLNMVFSTNKLESLQEAKEKFRIIDSLSQYMLSLVYDFNILGENTLKLVKSEVKLKDLLAFCEDISNTLVNFKNRSLNVKKEANVKILTEIDPFLPSIIPLDEIKIKQVLLNLLSNSIKFTSSGFIRLSMRYKKKKRMNSQGKEYIKFVVEDTGMGVSEDIKKNLFKEFNKSNHVNNRYGTGLGLKVVSDLVKLMDADGIKHKSNDNTTIFSFSVQIEKLDVDLNHKEEVVKLNYSLRDNITAKETNLNVKRTEIAQTYFNQVNIKKEDENNIKRVIVIDDEPFVRKSCIRVLEKYCKEKNFNLEIYEGSDGIDCLNFVYNFHNEKKEIDCIFMDETMNFLCGSVCSRVLKQLIEMRLINYMKIYILTAYEDISYAEEVMKNNVKAVIIKPLSISKLKELEI